MKKILIISNFYLPQKHIAVTRIISFAKYFYEFGYDVTVLTKGVENEFISTDGINIYYVTNKSMISKFDTNKKEAKIIHYLKCIYNIIFTNIFFDEEAGWRKEAIKKIREICINQSFDYILSSAPPISSHIIASEIKQKYPSIKWIADMRDGFTEKYLAGGEATVAYNPDDVSKVWLIEKGAYIPFELIESRYEGKELSDVELMQKGRKELVRTAAVSNLQAQINLAQSIEVIAASVKKPVHVNPHHVKKSKELDDNNPNKNDRKDPKTIAALVNEGRFSYPYIPTGVYAEIRSLSNLRLQAQEEITRIKNRIARWFSIYFPEIKDVYKNPGAVSGLMILKVAPLPKDIVKLGVDGVNQIWRDAKLRAAGLKRAKTLVTAAEHSIGSQEACDSARIELKILLNDYEIYHQREEELMELIEEKLSEVPYIDKLLEIKGIGMKTVSGFVAEVGDIKRFDNPKQLQKLAGYAIVECSSGKHKGESHISYRGRKRLRYVLYEAAISLIARNTEFKEIHRYYQTRGKNSLKKMQSVIAVACKALRIFYAILTKGVTYDGAKMLQDIKRPQLKVALSPSFRAACPDFPVAVTSSTINPFSAMAGCISVGSPTMANCMGGSSGNTHSIPPLPDTSSSHEARYIRL